VQRVNQALNGVKELEAPVALLKKSRDAEGEGDVSGNLRRGEEVHLRERSV